MSMELIEQILTYIGLAVTFCTAVCVALDKIVAVTPSTKDDEYVSTAKRWLGVVSSILDKFSVHQTKP